MKKMACFLLAILACVSCLQGTDKKAFTIDDLYRLKNLSGLSLSPESKRLVFELSESDLKNATRNTDLMELDLKSQKWKRLTRNRSGERSAFWSKDGKTVYFVSAREGSPQLYALPADGGEACKITDFAPGIFSPRLLPDGKGILFVSTVFPECGSDGACHQKHEKKLTTGPVQAHLADSLLYRHWTAYREFQYTHLFRCDLDTGEISMLTQGKNDFPAYSHGNGSGFDVSPDGLELCVVGNTDANAAESTNSDLFLLPLDGRGQLQNITTQNRAFDGDPLYSPDGRWIAYRAQAIPGYESDCFRIALYDRDKKTTRILTQSIDNWVDQIKWAPDSRSILFLVQEKGVNPLYQIDIRSGRITKLLTASSIREFVLCADGKGIIFTSSAVGKPVEIWSARFNGQAPVRLTQFNREIETTVDIRPAEQIWVKGADDQDIHVFIVKPHGFVADKKYPLIVNIHGGPQMMWSDSFRGDWQVYPGAGYVVAFANPHGSTGYGQDFTAAISKDWNGKVIEDILKVTEHLAALPFIDGNRMGAMGWSWGGYAVMWLEGCATPFKALASMMGVYDLRSMHGATEELWFPRWDLGGTPWENPDGYERMNPSSRVKQFKTPCLVITGEKDYRVPYTQSLQFFTDLQSMGVPSRLLVFKNDGHWPDNLRSMPVSRNQPNGRSGRNPFLWPVPELF